MADESPRLSPPSSKTCIEQKKISNFAAYWSEIVQYKTDKFSLESTLSLFFDYVSVHSAAQTLFLSAITSMFIGRTSDEIVPFGLDDDSTARAIAQLKEQLQRCIPDLLKQFNTPLTYLLDELICNIQQYAQTDKGYKQRTTPIEVQIDLSQTYSLPSPTPTPSA